MSTVSDAITSARELLQDTATPYRYSDERLVNGFNGAVREAFRLRPDLFLGNDYLLITYTTGTMGSNIPIEEQYYNALVAFVVGWAELSDDEFAIDSRAVALLTAFRNQLIGSNMFGGAQQ